MLQLYNNKEFLRFSIFLMWLLNISGFFGILSDQKDFYLSATPYVLSLTLFILVANHNLNQNKIIPAFFLIFLLGIFVEVLGVNYGLFFGDYEYGNTLGIQIMGVPLVIGFNWLMLTIICANFIENIFKKNIYTKVILASILMVSLDFLIEIVAPQIDFWEFNADVVPISNYIWWFFFSLVFQFIYFITVKEKEHKLSKNILVIHFLFFGLLALFL